MTLWGELPFHLCLYVGVCVFHAYFGSCGVKWWTVEEHKKIDHVEEQLCTYTNTHPSTKMFVFIHTHANLNKLRHEFKLKNPI